METLDTSLLERHFAQIGARVKVHPGSVWSRSVAVTVNIGRDRAGEYFDLALPRTATADMRAIDIQPALRHLVLMCTQPAGRHKFLCGHDERHWFVAAVPERARVTTVRDAFDALKPDNVRRREADLQVKPRHRYRRRNAAFVRQGEWFFVPVPASEHIDTRVIFRHEPISRGGGKPHICEELVRQGGELVYVCGDFPDGLNEWDYRDLLHHLPDLRRRRWTTRRRNARVFVRGKIRHRDHKTIILAGWHEVLMNTESQSAASRHVAFLD